MMKPQAGSVIIYIIFYNSCIYINYIFYNNNNNNKKLKVN